MLTIELNMYHAVALGAFLFWMGGIRQIRKHPPH